MLVHPPRKSFFRRQFWNLERITRLAVRREAYLVRILIIDADAHDIEIHHRAQLACEKPEEFLRRADCDEGLRNAEESFVSLGCRLPGRALVYVAHPYRQLRFDSISHLSQRLGAQKQRSSAFGLSTKYTRADAHVTHQQKAVNTKRFRNPTR